MEYVGGTNVRKAQANGVLSVGNEPPRANVSTHNEMSYANIYPEYFIIGCREASSNAAPTVKGDNVLMTKLLMELPLGSKLKQKGLLYIRNFYDEEKTSLEKFRFSSWQSVFQTNCFDELVYKAKDRLAGKHFCDVSQMEVGQVRISYNAPAFEYDPYLKRNLCFTSIGNHGYWFRKWNPFNKIRNVDRPFHLQFGDGTEFFESEICNMVEVANASSFPLKWETGKILVLDNRRFTHARPKFEIDGTMKRDLGVLLLNPTKRLGINLIEQDNS